MSVKVKLVLGGRDDYDRSAGALSLSSRSPLLPHHHGNQSGQGQGQGQGQELYLVRSYFVDTRSHSLRHVHATLPRLRAVTPIMTSSSTHNQYHKVTSSVSRISPNGVTHEDAQLFDIERVVAAGVAPITMPTHSMYVSMIYCFIFPPAEVSHCY